MYVCPLCKNEMSKFKCIKCIFAMDGNDQIPTFFSGSSRSNQYKEIADFYDSVYQVRENAWKDLAGRGEEFITYVGGLIRSFSPQRHLDIGCGQGYILGAASVPEQYGLDLSRKAMEAAKRRSDARLCQGIVEELPYPDNFFDIVTGIGVLEHFLDLSASMQEIARVLRPGGIFLTLVYVGTPFSERLKVKVGQFLFPRPRPIEFGRWIVNRFTRADHGSDEFGSIHTQVVQPVQNVFTAGSVERLFSESGFRIHSLITKRRVPNAPLEGHHFRIYIIEKVGSEVRGEEVAAVKARAQL